MCDVVLPFVAIEPMPAIDVALAGVVLVLVTPADATPLVVAAVR
jgi:hypothetical protein